MTNKQLVSSFNAWISAARPQDQKYHWDRITHNLFRYYDEATEECAFVVQDQTEKYIECFVKLIFRRIQND